MGCVAYAEVPKETRRKLDPNARKCIFIGYALSCKQYRLYNPVSKRLIISRDVVFSEKESYHTRAVGERGEKILHYLPMPIVPADELVRTASETVAISPLPANSPPLNEAEMELDTITVAPVAVRSSGCRLVWESEVSTGESWGATGETGGTGRRSRRTNVLIPPVDYTERDTSIDTRLMVKQGPATFNQAMATEEAVEWKEAIDSEAASIEENYIFEDISAIPQGKQGILT